MNPIPLFVRYAANEVPDTRRLNWNEIDLSKYVNGTIISAVVNPFDFDMVWVTVEGEDLPRLIKISELE